MRHLIYLFLLFFGINTAFSNPIAGIGAQGGLSVFHQHGVSRPDPGMLEIFMKDPGQGINVGAFAELLDMKYSNLNIHLVYNQKGGTNRDEYYPDSAGNGGFSKAVELKERLDYVSFVPELKLKYKIKNVEPFATIGPSFDYLANINSNRDPSALDFYYKFEISLSYGAGIGVDLTRNIQGYVSCTHQPSLTNFKDFFEDRSVNTVVKIDLGFLYRL